MVKANWGSISKKNDKKFFETVLCLANKPAKGSQIEFEWKVENSDCLLEVKTEKKFLLERTKLSYDQLRTVTERLKKLEILYDSVSKKGSKSWKFKLKLWSQDTHENLSRFEEEHGEEYKEPENPKGLEQQSLDNPTVDDAGDVNVPQTPDIEQQSFENKKLPYSDPLLDCTFFQGRQNELKQLTAWIENKTIRFIGIRGEGGIGKSTLATKVFTDSRDSRFFAGEGWFDLRTKPSITEVAERALQEFGVLSPEQMQFIEKKDLPQRLLCQLQIGRYLLALDNLESLLTPEGLWLAGYGDFFAQFQKVETKSVLLLTGREYSPKYFGWRRSEWLKLETGLESSEGAALLEALEAEGTKAEQEKVSVQVQGHPLALSLLAGWLRETYRKGNRSVQHLDKQQNLFQIPGKHGIGKPNILEQVFDWSFERLCPNSQTLLTQVSVMRGAFNIEAAATLVQRSVEDEELQDLERRCLLQELPAPDQYGLKLYRLQPRIQNFARKRAKNLAEAHERAIYFWSQRQTNLDTATTQEDAKEYLETFHHQCELQRYQAAAQTIFACNDFLQRRGYFQLLVDLYTQLDTRWQVTSDQHQEDKSRLCFNLGIAYDSLGQYKRAIEYQNKSLEIRKKIGDPKEEASCWRNLGNAYTSLRDYGQAIKYQQESYAITQRIGDRHGEANSLGNLGNIYTYQKKYPQAIGYYKQSLKIIKEISDYKGEADCLFNIGNVYADSKQSKDALEYLQQALDIYEALQFNHEIEQCKAKMAQNNESILPL